jgi:hypothetical protein
MASSVNASNTGFGGILMTGDSSGELQLQTAGTAALTIDTSQRAAFVAGTAALPAITTTGDTNTGIWFPAADTIAFAEGGAESMRIDSSGNVGIGTTSPATKLQVSGASGSLNTRINAGNTGLDITPNDATGVTDLATTPLGGGGKVMTFTTYTGSASAERMRIDSSGYVRVNNTSGIDGQFSSVTGSWYAGAFANTDAAYPVTYNWNRATSGNNLFMTFYTEVTAAARGTIDYNRAGNAVRYNTTSDQRLKENIIDAPSATSLINSIKIRSFDWKETGFHVDYGVIAQELNEVAPDAVSEGIDNEDGTIKQSWGVDTSVLVPALIKSIQEQQTIINDLKARVETLEAK